MKNIETILQEAGLEVTDEQKKKITGEVNQNYKTVNDWQKQVDKVKNLEDTLETTKTELKKFDGVNVEELNGKIKELNEAIEKQARDFEAKNADRDFNESLEKAIATAKGVNSKAIMALLDIDALKQSKNQQDDIKTALENLSKAEDIKMLFKEAEPSKIGEGNLIGTVKKSQEAQTETLGSALRDHYKAQEDKTRSITLAEAKVGMADKVDQQVIDEFRRDSFLLDRLVFDDAVSPGTGGSTMTYGYTRLKTSAKKIWTNSFNNYLYKACDAVGIERRSMHKIRKTYGTMLIDSGVDDSLTMAQMGHADITTTRKFYYFSNKNDSSKDAQILKAVII